MSLQLILPPDSTFLSSTIYEGILRYKSYGNSLTTAYNSVVQLLENESILLSGKNDVKKAKIPQKLFSFLQTGVISINKIDRNFIQNILQSPILNNINFNSSLHLKADIEDKEFKIGENNFITGLQILKCDRYTGLTSLDTKFSTKTIKLKISSISYIFCILGLVSSLITKSKDKKYYFLFFSPQEVLTLYNSGNQKLMRTYYNIKDQTIYEVRKILKNSPVLEVLLVNLILNLNLIKLIEKHNIDKISLMFFKIRLERGQAYYKIYEQININIYKYSIILKKISKYFINSDNLIEILHEIISPNGFILKRLKNDKNAEINNLIKAVNGLYQFIVLGNLEGWYIFIREITNCYEKTKLKEYREILVGLRFF